MPNVNKKAMNLHIEEISKEVTKGKHAVVIMDGAAWHQPDLNQDNVTILKLPPYSPELNPIEQVWQYIKQHWISNRCFKIFDEIVNVACSAWVRMSEQVEKLKSITSRTWIEI